jgi:transcriptional regulator with XRE-family HTH domain
VEGSEDHSALGTNLRRIRKQRGLRQLDLAEATGRSRSYIGQIEMGEIPNPGVETLYPIALRLGVTMETLIGRQPLHTTTTARIHRPSRGTGGLDGTYDELVRRARAAGLVPLTRATSAQWVEHVGRGLPYTRDELREEWQRVFVALDELAPDASPEERAWYFYAMGAIQSGYACT